MLKLAILVVGALTAVLTAPKPEGEFYKSKLDNINVEDVLKNRKLVEIYMRCALDKGRCTPDAQEIKQQFFELLPEILDTNCGKCTEDQKAKVRRVFHFLYDNRRSDFNDLLNKYDPDRKLRDKYKEKYQDQVNEEGFGDIFD